jgi:hypothetical protein
MILRHALVTASALLLLASTTMTTLASHGVAPRERPSVVKPPTSMATVMRYFTALKPQGRSIHDYQTLERLYAPKVTLTESLTTGRPRSSTGLREMRAFDELNTLSWTILSSKQLSRTVVLTSERPSVRGPGHELEHAAPWSTRFTIRNGKITRLVWGQLFQSGELHRRAASMATRQTA